MVNEINIINDYKIYKYNLKELSKKYDISIYMINKIFEKNNIEKFKKGVTRNNSLKHKDEIIKSYNNGDSINKIIKLYNTNYNTIKALLEENNILLHTEDQYRSKKEVNLNYFSNIDTERKAYILGLLYADGYLYNSNTGNRGISISLCEKDGYMINLIKDEMQSDHKILKVNHGNGGYIKNSCYRLNISKSKIYNDLVKIGLDNKNVFPVIDNNLTNHFIRGVFDGDGCISIRKARKGNSYEADIHMMGEEKFLIEMIDIIYKETGVIFSTPTEIRNIYRTRKSGRLNAIKFKNYIYKDATIYLQRKYEKFAQLTQFLQKS